MSGLLGRMLYLVVVGLLRNDVGLVLAEIMHYLFSVRGSFLLLGSVRAKISTFDMYHRLEYYVFYSVYAYLLFKSS